MKAEKMCPFCSSRMVGEIGRKVCANLSCMAYEVDTADPISYRKPLSKQEYKRRMKK